MSGSCGGGGVCWDGSVSSHVLLERAVVAEGVVSGGRLLGEETVEASWWAVARDRGVGAAAVAGVMVGLQVPALSADPTPFVCGWVSGACVYVMG